ncbi:MAG: hypothetical protein KJ587_18010 [Alphaproteobacteria bacterium]|nr:hypothetical protein [Alphaproteobacteria bacterium]
MDLSLPGIEVLRAIEKCDEQDQVFVDIETLVSNLDDPPLANDRSRILDTLRELKRKALIEFEVGRGVKITESGTVALRAL